MANILSLQKSIRSGIHFAALVGFFSVASCGGGGGNTQPANPVAPTIISIMATPSVLDSGGTSTIKWVSTKTSSCALSAGNVAVAGSFAANDSYTTPALSSVTTYTLTCLASNAESTVKSASGSVTILISSAIATAASGFAALPYLPGTIHYYCDCGTGADAACIPGDDANTGLDPALPKKTIANAIAAMHVAANGDTFALCKGGGFDNVSGTYLRPGHTCAVGTICNDLREYTPTTFTATAKPIITRPDANYDLFWLAGSGVRFLNLSIRGLGTSNTSAIFVYGPLHDITIGNVDIDGFARSVYLAPNGTTSASVPYDITVTGNHFTNAIGAALLGSANNLVWSYNYLDGNGSDNMFDHSLYISASHGATNVNFVGNYIHGQHAPTCLGSVIVSHGQFDGFNILNNVLEIDADKSAGGCWGIELDHGGYPTATFWRNARIAGNVIKNTGNVSLVVSNCPGCIVEDNLIIQDWNYGVGGGSVMGIAAPTYAARTSPADDVNTANIIRNNTIYFGPTQTGGATGIRVSDEGAGHMVINNSIYYSASVAKNGNGFNCLDLTSTLATSAYLKIDNNNCFSNYSAYKWEKTHGATLVAWKTYSNGFDTNSFVDDPLFTASGPLTGTTKGAANYFTPVTGSTNSPLIARGNAANASNRDITGKTRPTPSTTPSGLPAIGAFEPQP